MQNEPMTEAQIAFHNTIKEVIEFNKIPANRLTPTQRFNMTFSMKTAHATSTLEGFEIHNDTVDLLKQDKDLKDVMFALLLNLTLAAL